MPVYSRAEYNLRLADPFFQSQFKRSIIFLKERLANILDACWFSEFAEKSFAKPHDFIVIDFSSSSEQHFLRDIVLPHEVFQRLIRKISDAFFSSKDRCSKRVKGKRAQIKLVKNKFFRSVVEMHVCSLVVKASR